MPTSAVLSFKLVGSCNLIVCSDKFNVWVMFDLLYPKTQIPPMTDGLMSFPPGTVADFDKGKVFAETGFSANSLGLGFPGTCIRWPTKSTGVSLMDVAGVFSKPSLVFPNFGYSSLIELAGPDVKWEYTWEYLGNGVYGPYVNTYVTKLPGDAKAKLATIPPEGNLQLRSAPIQFSWPAGGLPKVVVKGCSSSLQVFGPASATISAGTQPLVRNSQLFRLNKEHGFDIGPVPYSLVPATYVEQNVIVQFSA
jgi:hypothetical protein